MMKKEVHRVILTCTYCGNKFERVIPPSRSIPIDAYCNMDCRNNELKELKQLARNKTKSKTK